MERAQQIARSEGQEQPVRHIFVRLVQINAALWGYLLWWASVDPI
jgi:hypothetical protein